MVQVGNERKDSSKMVSTWLFGTLLIVVCSVVCSVFVVCSFIIVVFRFAIFACSFVVLEV